MNTNRTPSLLLIAAMSALSPAYAFAFTTSFSHSAHASATALHLKSGQGNQLVAAFNAAAVKKDHDDDFVAAATNAVLEQQKHETAPANPEARSLAARLFSLDFNNHAKDDVVYYPLVGFKMVHHEGRVIPLPTSSTACCQIPTREQADQEVYGWFSPACHLDLYSEDICHGPTEEASS
ncbi:unnamed protein product [Cylindrotheca closterium]|uniref:Uncharacterized protein n=1 Tax=Cylindrotheca closterium TaxID=2856 RepID=A0AAD2CJU0_9STRA|nr:unnamed protein product [Cylindrotheca closterium]